MLNMLNNDQFDGHLTNKGNHLENGKNRVGYNRFHNQEGLKKHLLKVSYLYPEVHNCCENWTLPAPLLEEG